MNTLLSSRIGRAAGWVAGILVLGYASSLLSRGRAEAATGHRIAAEFGVTTVYTLPERPDQADTYPGSATILPRAGFDVRVCNSSPNQFDCFPWVGISHARVAGPFLVEVRWAAVMAPLGGRGTVTRYIALFGLVIPIGDVGGWIS